MDKKSFLKSIIASKWVNFKMTKSQAIELKNRPNYEKLNIVLYEDPEYEFREFFDKSTGLWITGDCKNGNTPFRRSFPSLLDIGIMGHCPNGKAGICAKAGIQCYQNAPNSTRENMKLEDFKIIIDQCKGKTFQVALGGAGDPNLHENFKEIVEYCRKNGIIPNYTTSGFNLTDEQVEISKQCGAVAVSQYSRLKIGSIPEYGTTENGEHICLSLNKTYAETNPQTNNAIQKFLDAGITTNIHYVLGKNTIKEAIIRLKESLFPKGINAIIFLLHKPVGLGQESNMLHYDDPEVKEFFDLIDNNDFPFKIGFDACSVPGIINFTSNIDSRSTETCEGSRTSAYIDAQMNMMPCSFGNQNKSYYVSLYDHTIKEAWESEVFEKFRKRLSTSCMQCKDRVNCYGGCPIIPEVVLCDRKEKVYNENKK